MNNRDYKQFGAGGYYHVYNRGNGKKEIFLQDLDFKTFLYRAKENLFPELVLQMNNKKPERYRRQILPAGAFSLICHCLMPNHFHLLIRQNTDLSITELIKKICVGYAKYFNKTHEKVGGLFEHKFQSVKIESNSYLLWLSAYIHQNPKVAGLVQDLEEWKYSSYLDFIGKRQGKLCEKDIILGQFKNSQEYEDFVKNSFGKIKERKELKYLLLDEN